MRILSDFADSMNNCELSLSVFSSPLLSAKPLHPVLVVLRRQLKTRKRSRKLY